MNLKKNNNKTTAKLGYFEKFLNILTFIDLFLLL
jgi:hypothetical protein